MYKVKSLVMGTTSSLCRKGTWKLYHTPAFLVDTEVVKK